MKFTDKLLKISEKNNSWLCVGLDSDLSKIPTHLGKNIDAILEFNRRIIESTSDLVCAYKPNSAFYECLGSEGWPILKETIDIIPDEIPVILDFKRGDIGNTAKMYAKAAFENLKADAVTISPYMGKDSVEPFLDYKEKGIFILCLTSNPSSSDIQKQIMLVGENSGFDINSKQENSFINVYEHVSNLVVSWNKNENIGLVVGATSTLELEKIRKSIGENMPILIPGIGAQGGDLESSINFGSNSKGKMAIINVSRGIIYAGTGDDFEIEARKKAKSYKDQINNAINKKSLQY